MTHSQNKRILEYLRRGHSLTPLLALKLFGSLRLAARAWDLRRQGVRVQQRMIRVGGKRVSVYWL